MKDQETNRRFKSGIGKVMMYVESLKLCLIMLGAAFIILVNGMVLASPIVGASASLAYFIVGAYSLKRVFRGNHSSVNFTVGTLLLLILLSLIGWGFTISYKLGVIEVFITLCAGIFFVSLVRRFTQNRPVTAKRGRKHVKVFVRFLEVVFLGLTCLQFLLLLQSRTSIPTTVWESLDPRVMPVFFLSTMLLIIIMLSGERWKTSLLLILIQSVSLHMFFVLVFDAGYGQDQWSTLGTTRRLFDESHYPQGLPFHIQSPYPLVYKIFRFLTSAFQPALSTMLSRLFSVDAYWGHLLLVPLMWGIFVPVIAYGIAEIATRKQVLGLLSALLSLATPPLIMWGAVSTSNSLGYFFFFFTVFLLLDYLSSDRTVLWAALSSFVTLLAHLLPGVMAFSLLFFAHAFKRYRHEKLDLALVFLLSVTILPLALYFGRVAYPALTGADFTIEPLRGLSTFDAIMLVLVGTYADLTVKEAIVGGLLPLFGLFGLIYVNMAGNKFANNKGLSRFLLFIFILVIVDYRIAKCFMVKVPFGTDRILVLRDMLAIPFASVLVYKLVAILSNVIPKGITVAKRKLKEFIGGSFRSFITRAIAAVCLSALVMSSVYLGYPTRRYPWLTSKEVQAARFIHSSANHPYVVVCYKFFSLAGYAVAGTSNPMAYYSRWYDGGWLDGLFEKACSGSAAPMFEAAEVNNASDAFFVTSRLRVENADSAIEALLERSDFELYAVFEDDIYILRYIFPLERFITGTGPSVYIYSHERYADSSFFLDKATFQATYKIELVGSNIYSLTNWPNHWSFESIVPRPTTHSIDANTWINFTGTAYTEYQVIWTAHILYQPVGWKDDSFIKEWTARRTGRFVEIPKVVGDGDILTLTGEFQKGVREYYWCQKAVNISTDLYPYVLVRWDSTNTCAIAWVYYTDGSGEAILSYGSYTPEWTTTIVRLTEGKTIDHVMVGLDDYASDTEGVHSVYFDFIMLANRTKPPLGEP